MSARVNRPVSLGVVLAIGLCMTATQAATDYVFVVDAEESTVTLEVVAVGLSDSDTSGVMGTVDATLMPSSGAFTVIHITGLDLDLTSSLDLHLDGGFLGGVFLTGTDVGLRMGGGFGDPGAPAAVDATGDFEQFGNLIQAVGTLDYEGYGVLGDPLGSGTEDLATFNPAEGDLAGNVSDDGQAVTLVIPLNVAGSLDFGGVPVSVTAIGLLVARADTIPELCPGDTNCDGVVDFDDIDPFVAALGCPGGTPDCWPPDCPWLNGDCNGDETVDFDDIDPFVARIGATCP